MLNRAMNVPEWFKNSSVYQINPRTFSAEGTIRAVTERLPELASLGFGIMYLCPIFEEDETTENWSRRQILSETMNPKNPYRITDYFSIDSEYGTMEDLKEFVERTHQLGMHVILDLVFLHAGPNAKILKAHPEFAKQDADGNWLLNEWNFATFDYTNPGTREYLWSNMVYYIGAIGVDGFRCDVGDQVPEDFWVEGRRRIQAIKPDAILINEGKKFFWMKNAFDATYAFAWHSMLYKAFTQGESAQLIRQQWEADWAETPSGGLLLRDIDNHDTVTDWPMRTETAAGHDGMEQIIALNYLMDGIPMVYCGNEIACEAKLSLFANRFHPGRFSTTDWQGADAPAAIRRQDVIRKLNALRRESSTLQAGMTRWLEHDQPNHVIAFSRHSAQEEWLFIGNASDEECTVRFNETFNGEVVLTNIEALPSCADLTVLTLKAKTYLILRKNLENV